MKQMSFDFNSRRSMVVARRGMVSTSNPLAAQTGLDILRQGGNAADAAVATAAMLNVTEPASTGIGGDCFALYYDAQTGHVTALNGSGRSPAALNMDVIRQRNITEWNVRDALAITVPGAARGWEDMLARHGRMTLSHILSPAIDYAKNGFPVHPLFASSWQIMEPLLRNSPNTGDYLPNGSSPAAGQVVTLPGLADTFQQVADGGADAFYTGPIADAIVKTVQAQGGVMTHDDLKNHTSTWDDPIKTDYRGVTVWECPPNGQGLAALQALNIAQHWDLNALPLEQRLHVMVEAMRLAFADARHYIADMNTDPAPLDALLSEEYARQRAEMISLDRAMQPPSYGTPDASSDTVYLSVVDGDGNACSFINSLYMGFGTGIVAEGTGVFLQNRGALFTLGDESHPNALAPNKRPYHTIIPGMATQNGQLYASFGVMGGFMQPQGHFQMMSALVDHDLNPQEALNLPRFCLSSGTSDSTLMLEEGLPVSVMSALAAKGHTVQPVSGRGRGVFGDGHIIRRDPESGVLYGGADPRKDGLVAAF